MSKYSLAIVLVLVLATAVRIIGLTKVPPGFYWEEVAMGYDAYSLLKTGRDHHGHPWPLVAFESYGDWKPTLYGYALIPSIAVFGLTATAVRLPAALAGISVVASLMWLVYLWQRQKRLANPQEWRWLAPVVGGVAAFSPWLVIFSRAGWEVMLATALVTTGVGCLFAASPGKPSARWWLVGAGALFILSMYAYHAARVIAPLLGLGWLGLFGSEFYRVEKSLIKKLKLVLPAAVVVLLGLWPFYQARNSVALSHRLAETSIFSDLTPIIQSNLYQEQAGHALWARLAYHRYVFFALEIGRNFLSHLRFDFLFLSGDANPRHSIQWFGQLYHIELLALLFGLGLLFRRSRRLAVWLFWWWAVALLPASITKAAPHALRTLFAAPVFMILIGVGWVNFGQWARKLIVTHIPRLKHWAGFLITGGVVAAYALEFGLFAHYYGVLYPLVWGNQWQVGYPELIQTVSQLQSAQPDALWYITREQGRPAMYYWFYTRTDPAQVQAASPNLPQDQGEALAYDQLSFVRSVAEIKTPGFIASSPEQLSQARAQWGDQRIALIKEIDDLQHRPVWMVYQLTP